MSWLGLLQGTKFGTAVRAVRGGSCGSVKGAGGTGCFQGTHWGADAPRGVLGRGMHTGSVPCQDRWLQPLVLMAVPHCPFSPRRRRYGSDSNQPLPGEPASASDPEPDASEPRDGQQPLVQHRAPSEHGANTSVFHGPRARGHGPAAGHGHHPHGAGAEHCRINAPSSAQYRNAASSLPGCKYN